MRKLPSPDALDVMLGKGEGGSPREQKVDEKTECYEGEEEGHESGSDRKDKARGIRHGVLIVTISSLMGIKRVRQ